MPGEDALVQAVSSDLRRLLVANIHLLPLPGSHNYERGGFDPVIGRAVEEARIAADAGFDAVLLQNAGDGRFRRDGGVESVAYMTAIGAAVKQVVSCRVGINILSVGATTSIAVAHALGAAFVRIKVYVGAVVTPSGVVDGSYAEALDFRDLLDAKTVSVTADVFDRSSWALGGWTIAEAAQHAHEHGKADILIITGRSVDESLSRAGEVKVAVPGVGVWCGGGTTPANIGRMLEVYDGAIVGQGIKQNGDIRNKFDAVLARRYVAAARSSDGR
jgi:membrane complex biogenesis BtpA family protein